MYNSIGCQHTVAVAVGCSKVEYPAQYESEELLKDGSRLRIRPIRLEDAEAWVDFVSRLGLYTKYLRFHHVPKKMGMEDALHFCTVDYKDSFALVAEIFRECRWSIVAIGRYYRLPSRYTAEFALVVEDAYQGKGIGTKMMECLVNAARDNDITTFVGDVLVENDKMMAVLKDYGFQITSELKAGVYRVTFPITKVGS
ncbi:MAG: GNAT family N-acetyltransferase [Chloroflexi bacterium]|nr:GNAT family N-acetyltransferase [Chloroflexota bacterium]